MNMNEFKYTPIQMGNLINLTDWAKLAEEGVTAGASAYCKIHGGCTLVNLQEMMGFPGGLEMAQQKNLMEMGGFANGGLQMAQQKNL